VFQESEKYGTVMIKGRRQYNSIVSRRRGFPITGIPHPQE
jgi:hypothetical protein